MNKEDINHVFTPIEMLCDGSGPLPGIMNTRCIYCKQTRSVVMSLAPYENPNVCKANYSQRNLFNEI